MNDKNKKIEELVAERNACKQLFTAGPASLLSENLTGLRPCFGRGDEDYANVEQYVLTTLLKMSGHTKIARMQGSASLALEIMTLNFLFGKVLIINTGYYSDRLNWLAESGKRRGIPITEITYAGHETMENIAGNYDWLMACPTETSRGLKLPIEKLGKLAKKLGAKLMLDATASIGLEENHHLADVLAYSSCKGLFGLTGASFIAFNETPETTVDSFYLNLGTHLNKSMTGPYHAIASLADVLPRHHEFRQAVVTNKQRFIHEMKDYLTLSPEQQPFLCTHVSCLIKARDAKAVLYNSRGNVGGSIVCHLGEAHLGLNARGDILNSLYSAGTEKENC